MALFEYLWVALQFTVLCLFLGLMLSVFIGMIKAISTTYTKTNRKLYEFLSEE